MGKQKDITPIFKAIVKDGKLLTSDPQSYNSWISKLNGKKVSVKVARWHDIRSNAQNRFLWLYYRIISDELTGGDTPPEYYHEYFKRIFLAAMKISVLNKDILIPGSTADLSKYQFSQYLLKIEKETGVPIPNPKLFGYDKEIYSRTITHEIA